MELRDIEMKYESILKTSASTFRFLLAVVKANLTLVGSDPIWVLIVGGSGRAKTETINPFLGLPEVIPISDFNAQSLVSGLTGAKQGYGLLQRLPHDTTFIIAVKDMSGVLSLHPDRQNQLFSILRDVYDGHYSRPFGNKMGTVVWKGKLGFIGAVTTAIDQHYNAREKFGSRFLLWRCEERSMREDINLTINTLQKSSKVKEWREELREAVKDLLTNSPRIRVSVSSDMQKKIANVGTLASYSRSPVVRYGYGSREIIDICDREIGTRISNELMMTGVGLAMLRSDSEVSDEDLKFLIKSALDSMPKTRRCVLRSLCEGGASSCAEVSRSVRLPETTVRYLLQDLQAVKLVVSDNFWDISDDCRILIESTGFSDPRELWWTYDSAL